MDKGRLKVCMFTPGSMLHDARIQKEAQALNERGYEVRIVCIEDYLVMEQYGDDSPQWQAYFRSMQGIRTDRHVLKSRKWRNLPSSIRLALQSAEMSLVFLLASIRIKADVYHCHDLIPGFFTCIAKFIHRGKLVYDAHEMEIEMMGAKGLARKMLGWYEGMVVKYSDARITVNDYIREFMEDRYGKEVTVIENRPMMPENLDRNYLRNLLDIPEDTFVIMYVGFLSMARGIDKMVEALKYLPDNVKFYLLGTGRVNEFKRIVGELSGQHSLTNDRIVFIDPVPPNEVLNVLCGADLSVMLYQTVHTNNQINTPNKLFQSVAAGVPVLASNNMSFQNFLIREEGDLGVLVDESDPKDIADKVEYVMSNGVKDELVRVLSKEGIAYTWEGQKQKLLDLYESLKQ